MLPSVCLCVYCYKYLYLYLHLDLKPKNVCPKLQTWVHNNSFPLEMFIESFINPTYAVIIFVFHWL